MTNFQLKLFNKISQHTNTKPGMLVTPSTYSCSSLQDANVSITLKFLRQFYAKINCIMSNKTLNYTKTRQECPENKSRYQGHKIFAFNLSETTSSKIADQRAKSEERTAKSQERRAMSEEPRAKSQERSAKSHERRAKCEEP